MKLVILSGQSLIPGGGGSEGGDLTPNSHVKIWNGSAWVTAAPGTAPFFPTESGKQPRNNVGWNFCKRLQEETGEDVYMILSGLGSTPISAWAYPAGAQWAALDTAVKHALATPQLAGRSSPDYFLWIQGGSDTGNTHYRADLEALRAAMIAQGWLTDTTPFICGETHANNEAKTATQELWSDPASYAWMGYASNADIEMHPVYPHPTGAGCVDYGRNRVFAAAMDIPRKYPRKFRRWTPTLLTNGAQPTVAYDFEKTYGGAFIDDDGRVTAWFRLTLASLTGGSGGMIVGGLPFVPSVNTPGMLAMTQASVATDVTGANIDPAQPILLGLCPEGIRLLRPIVAGTQGLTPARATGTFSLRGSVSYFVDGP